VGYRQNPVYLGWLRPGRTPFPTLSASISTFGVVATNSEEPLVTGVDDILGTHTAGGDIRL